VTRNDDTRDAPTAQRALTASGEELAAQQRLSRAHLAGDLDEALAVRDGHQQRVQRFLAARAGVEEARVGGDPERGLAQAEMGKVDHFAASDEPPPILAPRFCIRSRARSMSCSQSLSPLITVGLSKITNSFFTMVRVVLRKAAPMPGMS